ncbi:MAG TPA: JAB domain-containing protein [Nitrospira sp.]|nr:JAB domain-containing protein [Nitrospira sp.]
MSTRLALPCRRRSIRLSGRLRATVREVFKPAILLNACAIIAVHNHPSGDPTPSPEDRTLTTRLRDAGDLLGIRLFDHLILGDDRLYSFADQGWPL